MTMLPRSLLKGLGAIASHKQWSFTVCKYGMQRACSTVNAKDNKVQVQPSTFIKEQVDVKKSKKELAEQKHYEVIASLAEEHREFVLAELQSQLTDPNSIESEKKFIQWQIDNFDNLKMHEVGFLVGRQYKYLPTYHHPLERTLKIFANDFVENFYDYKGRFQLLADHIRGIDRPMYMRTNAHKKIFSEHVDVAVIGGGMLGLATAFHLLDRTRGLRVVVLEKDLGYSESSSISYTGEICHSFTENEDIRLAKLGTMFIEKAHIYLGDDDYTNVNIDFNANGHLALASANNVDQLLDSFSCQRFNGIHVKVLNRDRLKVRFPWLQTDGIEAGLYCLQKAGWYEPFNLHSALARKAKMMGCEIVQGEVVGATIEGIDGAINDCSGLAFQTKTLEALQVRLPDSSLRSVTPGECVIAAGHQSQDLGRLLGIGSGSGPYSIPVPSQKRTQRLFSFYAPDGPGLNLPFLKEDHHFFVRREGLAHFYVCGRDYPDGRAPDPDMSPEEQFDHIIRPLLSRRVNGFQKIKLIKSWERCYNVNPIDERGIVGRHPMFANLFAISGFSQHGPHFGVGATKYLTDIMLNRQDSMEDLSGLNYDRVFERSVNIKPVEEIEE